MLGSSFRIQTASQLAGPTSTLLGCKANKHFGKNLGSSFEDLDIFQVGGVIFF